MIRSQKAWRVIAASLVLCFGPVWALELRTWTFSQDGQMRTSADGTVSFKRRGRIEAAFIRLDTNNIALLATRTGYLTIAATNLSEVDRSYIARMARIDKLEDAPVKQNSLVRNEMARRKREAEKLREDAAEKRRLAQFEVETAERLDSEALELSARANSFQFEPQAPEPTRGNTNNAASVSSGSGRIYVKSQSQTAIAAGAADQLAQDVAQLRRQAQGKRDRAARLQNEAQSLDRTAKSEELTSTADPAISR